MAADGVVEGLNTQINICINNNSLTVVILKSKYGINITKIENIIIRTLIIFNGYIL